MGLRSSFSEIRKLRKEKSWYTGVLTGKGRTESHTLLYKKGVLTSNFRAIFSEKQILRLLADCVFQPTLLKKVSSKE